MFHCHHFTDLSHHPAVSPVSWLWFLCYGLVIRDFLLKQEKSPVAAGVLGRIRIGCLFVL
jgi:hypothetical protein